MAHFEPNVLSNFVKDLDSIMFCDRCGSFHCATIRSNSRDVVDLFGYMAGFLDKPGISIFLVIALSLGWMNRIIMLLICIAEVVVAISRVRDGLVCGPYSLGVKILSTLGSLVLVRLEVVRRIVFLINCTAS